MDRMAHGVYKETTPPRKPPLVTSLWLHISLLVALALGAWIVQLDATGDPDQAVVLWGATALLTAWLAARLILRRR